MASRARTPYTLLPPEEASPEPLPEHDWPITLKSYITHQFGISVKAVEKSFESGRILSIEISHGIQKGDDQLQGLLYCLHS